MTGAVFSLPLAVRSALIVVNPAAGGYSASRIADVESGLRRNGVRVETILTKQAGDAAAATEGPLDRIDVVIVHGGDGTIAEAIAGLHRRGGARPALAVIPGGTANVLACEFHLPFRAREIVDLVVAGRRRPLYYALANGRPFFLMVSAGIDAAAVHGVSPAMKRKIGRAAFIFAAVSALRAKPLAEVRAETADGLLGARIAVVANAACYGGPHLLARTTAVDRPGLRLVRVMRDDPASLLRVGWTMLARTKKASPLTSEQEIGRVTLTSETPIPVQVDGEAFGMTPVEIEPVAEPLAILVPA